MSRVVCCVVVVMCAAACDETGPTALKDFDRAAFTQARARWQSAGISNYTVESRQACFCPAHLYYWTRVTVRGSSIVSAEPVEPLPSGIPSHPGGWRTVPELFAFIESAASSDDNMRTRIAVTYDATLGYPKEVSMKCRETIADCEADFFMRGLTRTP